MNLRRQVLLLVFSAVGFGACARTPPSERDGSSAVAGGIKAGRTLNGHTYTDAPVDVKLGPNTFRIPANYLDSQIAPWPGEGVTLVLEWPDMVPSEPGARANPRANDFRKEVSILIDFIDSAPIATSLDRLSSNNAVTREGSLERTNPADRLELRIAQPELMGLTPYVIDERMMQEFTTAYAARYGRVYTRNPAFELDWYVAHDPGGRLVTFIKCDSAGYRKDGVILEGSRVISEPGVVAAGCVHYMSDIENSLSFRINYKRAFLQDWQRMERAVRDVLKRYKM